MTPDKRAFEALLDDYLRKYIPYLEGNGDVAGVTQARAAVLQAYDEAAGREGQPVAWMVRDREYSEAFTERDSAEKFINSPEFKVARREAVWTIEPLYTHPAPKAVEAADVREFWMWLDQAYQHGSIGDDPKFTKWNMQVSYEAGRAAASFKPDTAADWEGWTVHAKVNMPADEKGQRIIGWRMTPPPNLSIGDQTAALSLIAASPARGGEGE